VIQNSAEVPYNLEYRQEDKPLEESKVKVVPLHATKAHVRVEVYKLHELFTLAIYGGELISFGPRPHYPQHKGPNTWKGGKYEVYSDRKHRFAVKKII